LNRSREQAEDFSLTLSRYAIERLLYRLAQSVYADQFVLKGALLFVVWTGQTYRPTRDLDLAGFGDSSPDRLRQIFSEVCRLAVEADGLEFEPDSIRIAEIRETQEYPGQRVRLTARLGRAEISLQIDIDFGDAMTPAPDEAEYPTLLNLPAPRLKVCPKETVIAEKLQAMVTLGMVNSRMKDFYDIWLMTRQFSFEGRVLEQAIRSTFERRETEIPAVLPVALTAKFGQEPEKQTLWQAFLERSRLETGQRNFAEIVSHIAEFLAPLLAALANHQDFNQHWSPGTGWT
jgi:predicted nucleotidyltransferase component of viral defense system